MNADARSLARDWFARFRGTPLGRSVRCACCGPSLFGPAQRPRSELISDSFSDLDLLLDPTAPELCAGCEGLLSGRPGDDPPPFRTLSAIAGPHISGGGRVLDASGVAAVLVDPPAQAFAVSWSRSRKKHAWLRAEASTPERIVVGTDDGPVTYVRGQDRGLLEAVRDLLWWFRRDAIATGNYPTPAVATCGAARWAAFEAVVSPRRPSPLLSMLAAVLARPTTEPGADTPVPEVGMERSDEDAVELLGAIAEGSGWRREDGLAFWSHLFRRRIQRYQRHALPDFVSRLLGDLRVQPHNAAAERVAALLLSWDEPRQQAVSAAIKARADLLIVIAYGRREKR